MTRRANYYEKETWGEFFLRFAERVLKIIVFTILVTTIVVIKQGDIKLEKLEKESGIFTLNYYESRPPLTQMVEEYINTLPVPEMEKEEIQQQVEKEILLYEQDEVELLARLMYAEEGIFIYKLPEEEAKYVCQLAGSVVIHRKNMNYNGAETIEEVIYADGQYQCVKNGSINQEIPDIVIEWAEELLKDGPIGPENMVFQAEFEQGSETFKHIGNQYFCLK